LGGGVADLTTRANLTALIFVPCAQTSWNTADPAQRVVQGPDGVLIQNIGGNCKINLTSTSITLSCGGHSVVIGASGVTIDGKQFLTHEHSGVQSGGSNTGGVV